MMKKRTAKERRAMSRSDEEIIDELDVRLGYRMGWPKPLPVLPVKQIPIIGESEYVDKFASVSRVTVTRIKFPLKRMLRFS
jgi:hypothetical protein